MGLITMENDVELGTISARGQICIPTSMRDELGFEEGSRILFLRVNDSLMLKKVNMQTFEEITRPLKEEAKRLGLKESDAVDMVHRARKKP